MPWGMSGGITMFQFTRPRGARHEPHRHVFAAFRFNSRAHGGRDPAEPSRANNRHCFNSRAHGGRDTVAPCAGTPRAGFNSRAHGGRDPHTQAPDRTLASFNSRAHGGRDLRGQTLAPWKLLFQFTRPRGARLHPAARAVNPVDVSIHAPTGGATRRACTNFSTACFNSRAHGGRDECHEADKQHDAVSIHAPTGGATHRLASDAVPGVVSIHAPTGGATG